MESDTQNSDEKPVDNTAESEISEFAGYSSHLDTENSVSSSAPENPPFMSLTNNHSASSLINSDNQEINKAENLSNSEISIKTVVSENPKQKENNRSKFVSQIFNKHHRKPVLLGFLAGVLLFFGFTSLSFFSNHAMPNSYLGDQDISFWSNEKISAHASAKISSFNITIEKDSEKTPVLLSAIGVDIDQEATTTNIFNSQKSIFEKLQIWKKRNYSYQGSIDEKLVQTFANSQKTSLSTASQNAAISIEDGQVIVIDEINADEWILKDPIEVLKNAISISEPINFKLSRVTSPPEITSAKLEPLKEHIQTLIQTPLALSINGKIISSSADQRASWLTIDAGSTDTTAAHFDPVKIESYVDGVTRPYIKPPRSRVVVTASDGSIKELVAGEDGVSITNISALTSQIIKALESKKSATIDIPVAYAERSTITAADYPKWLQADLTNKRIYAYEHGTLVNEYAMSAGAPETPTVVGEYKITYKVRKQTMRGLNSDGTRYTQPDVEWVNYFYQDYAIHGNYWRPASVFGNVNTSHGCVGLPNANAEWIYNWAPVGTPVITHY